MCKLFGLLFYVWPSDFPDYSRLDMSSCGLTWHVSRPLLQATYEVNLHLEYGKIYRITWESNLGLSDRESSTLPLDQSTNSFANYIEFFIFPSPLMFKLFVINGFKSFCCQNISSAPTWWPISVHALQLFSVYATLADLFGQTRCFSIFSIGLEILAS